MDGALTEREAEVRRRCVLDIDIDIRDGICRPTEADAQRGNLTLIGRRRHVAPLPMQRSAGDGHGRPTAAEIGEDLPRRHHNVDLGILAVDPHPIGLDQADRRPRTVDGEHVPADQPPDQRLEVRRAPHVALGRVVGVDPHRPPGALEQRGEMGDTGSDFGEPRVELQQMHQRPVDGIDRAEHLRACDERVDDRCPLHHRDAEHFDDGVVQHSIFDHVRSCLAQGPATTRAAEPATGRLT